MSRPGIATSGAYQVSGTPYITASVILSGTQCVKIEFPCVTKSITVVCKDANKVWPTSSYSGSAELFVFFGPDTITGSFPYPQITKNHYLTIPSAEDGVTLDIKCSQVFIGRFNSNLNAAYQIFAELTSIPAFDLYQDGVREAGLSSGAGIVE